MRGIDFSSWQGIVGGIVGLLLVTLIGIGLRMVFMMTIQQRQQRMNRQINERLRTLIAAYKVLGGSFTGDLTVNPMHQRDLRAVPADAPVDLDALEPSGPATEFDRPRRIRDAVEAALSDIILLGTEEQVRLAARAATQLVAGNRLQTHDLVVSLRTYIRTALDLETIPADLVLPPQGPTRPGSAAGGRGKSGGESARGGGGQGGGGSGGGAGGGGGGMGMGMAGLGVAGAQADDDNQRG